MANAEANTKAKANDNLRCYMGFAMRAGQCRAGDFIAEKLVSTRKASLIHLDEPASESTKQRYRELCDRAGIPCLTMENMGQPIGKDGRMVAAVTDAHFAQMIQGAYEASKQAE